MKKETLKTVEPLLRKQCFSACGRDVIMEGQCTCANATLYAMEFPLTTEESFPTPPTYVAQPYKPNMDLETGRYLVVRKDGKTHKEMYNGTGFAYSNNNITHFYLPKIDEHERTTD